jgi:hypothetical protein
MLETAVVTHNPFVAQGAEVLPYYFRYGVSGSFTFPLMNEVPRCEQKERSAFLDLFYKTKVQ